MVGDGLATCLILSQDVEGSIPSRLAKCWGMTWTLHWVLTPVAVSSILTTLAKFLRVSSIAANAPPCLGDHRGFESRLARHNTRC